MGWALAAALAAASLATCITKAPAPEESHAFVAFVVRHAEPLYPPPADAADDPPLNIMGQNRADALARALEREDISAVFATDRRRTQETAAPTATNFDLPVQTYDSGDPERIVEAATQPGARTLIVGHSNTVANIVVALGAEAGPEIDTATEFDRLTVVAGTLRRAHRVELRYGEPLPDDWRDLAATRRPGVHD